MSEEMDESGGMTPEQLMEMHQREIDERFEEKGFFRRLGDMVKGFSRPRASREYKLAVLELQRLKAPIIAILLPVLGVGALIVMTAVSGQQREIIKVDIAKAQDAAEELVEETEPEPEEIDMTQDVDVSIDVSADVSAPSVDSPAPPSPSPGGEPDKVAAVPSPVTMANVAGTVKMRGIGNGEGGGFGTVIGGGGGQNTEGCLVGVLIDFKRDANGKDVSCDGGMYRKNIGDLAKANFSSSALSRFFVLPKKVALTHVRIPVQPAENGPKAFGAEKLMQAKWWAAYYHGTLKPVEKARYRFVGYFDEVLLVKVGGKVALECYWGMAAQAGRNDPGPYTGWKPSDASMIGKWGGGHDGAKLVVGDWFTAEPGRGIDVDVVIGEGPGGKCGGILLIEKEGEKYDMRNGHPVLPIFCSRPLSYKEKEKLAADGFGLSVNSPKFNGKVDRKAMEKVTKDDIEVDLDGI